MRSRRQLVASLSRISGGLRLLELDMRMIAPDLRSTLDADGLVSRFAELRDEIAKSIAKLVEGGNA